MERTKERSSFRKKFIGDRKFYMMVLAVAVPIMIQNGITNFVSLLDNIMTVSYTHLISPEEEKEISLNLSKLMKKTMQLPTEKD